MSTLEKIQAAAAKAEKVRPLFVPEWDVQLAFHRLASEEGLAFVRRHHREDEDELSEAERAAATKAQQVDLIALTARDDSGQPLFDTSEGRRFLAGPDVDFSVLNRLALAAMGLNGMLAAEKNSSTTSTTRASPSSGSSAES
jgi:hypothetical protein